MSKRKMSSGIEIGPEYPIDRSCVAPPATKELPFNEWYTEMTTQGDRKNLYPFQSNPFRRLAVESYVEQKAEEAGGTAVIFFDETTWIGMLLDRIWYFASLKEERVLPPDEAEVIVERMLKNYDASAYEYSTEKLVSLCRRFTGMGQYAAKMYSYGLSRGESFYRIRAAEVVA